MQSKPLVSVVIPTFNRSKLVLRAIDSVLSQTYTNIEIIVVDDGSTDNTGRIIEDKYGKLMDSMKLRYWKKENGGCASALNEGIRRSEGKLIMWLSSDDWYETTMVEKSVNAHQDSSVGLTFTKYRVHSKDKTYDFDSFEPKTREEAIEKLYENCYINGSSIMVKKEVFYHVGFFNDFFRYSQDYDFFFRVLSKYTIKLIPEVLLNYTDQTGSTDVNWLGLHISDGTHDNEAEVVKERYKLMLNPERPKVCAMLCLRNEETQIEKCLNDLSMFVDEIVIFDDDSDDLTYELSKKWVKVTYYLKQKRRLGFRTEGSDRQKLLELAYYTKCNFALFIDADEQFEDRYKTKIFKEMDCPDVNLWFYHEINFWRSNRFYRIDNLFDNGWFGRLFRLTSGLKLGDENLHCGSVPYNIPNATNWYDNSKKTSQRKSEINVKHYSWDTEEKVISKFLFYWNTDKSSNKVKKERYERLIYEGELSVKEYLEQPYYAKIDYNENIFDISAIGVSRKIKKEHNLKFKGDIIFDEIIPTKITNIENIDNKSVETKEKKRNNYFGKNILIVGNGNSFRSQFLYCLLKMKGNKVVSCGINPNEGTHKEVKNIFNEFGVDTSLILPPQKINESLINWSEVIISFVDLNTNKEFIKLDIPDGSINNKEGIRGSLRKIEEALT